MASLVIVCSVLLVILQISFGCGARIQRSQLSAIQEAGIQDRLECWLSDDAANQPDCQALGCIWDDKVPSGTPACFFPRAGYGYRLAPPNSNNYIGGFDLDLERMPARSRFGTDAENLKFQVRFYPDSQGNQNTVRFKFYDPSRSRYEVPIFKDLDQRGSRWDYSSQQNDFEVAYGDDDLYGFNFQVTRKGGAQTTIFNSSIGGLTFSDQFLQIATYLPAGCSLYGIGENPHPTYQHDMRYKTWPLFSRDVSPMDGSQNIYGVHPFYMCVEADGKAHGVFFLNSNAMEFTTLPAPGISFRTTGGILDFFLFVGDSPNQVTTLYHEIIGKTFMPAYWSLGFQLCRWGYKGLEDIEAVYNRTTQAGLPYDVQYSDIDYMDQKKDFTWDKVNFAGLDRFVNETKAKGLRWVFILDPALLATDPNYEPYNEGKSLDVFVHWPNDIPAARRSNPPAVDTSKNVIYGNVWPSGPVAFPDFFHNGTRDWWLRSIGRLYADLKFDGLWIDMNEPSNSDTNGPAQGVWHLMCPTNKYDDPAYLPLAARTWGRGVRMAEKTLCMASVQGDYGQYRHYDVHSLYGWSETEPTARAVHDLTKQRGMVFSRSTYASSGKYGGHWLGDNFSRWVDLHRSIIGILEFNLFGVSYVGADICGFNDEADPEMCKRWMQLGAFYPLARNHNTLGTKDQDPAAFGGDVLAASKRALNIRYRLLPYLYTLFHAAHTRGTKVIYGLVDWYPTDSAARGIDTQFMWGNGLLISPALEKDQRVVEAYLPGDDWYDYHSSLKVREVQPGSGKHISITNLTDTPLHVRGGTIFPAQDPAVNTMLSRQNPFSLLVYPTCGNTATGELFWDDGVTIDSYENNNFFHLTFSLQDDKFVIEQTNPHSVFSEAILLRDVKIFNTNTNKTQAVINSVTPVPIVKDAITKSITIQANISASRTMPKMEIVW